MLLSFYYLRSLQAGTVVILQSELLLCNLFLLHVLKEEKRNQVCKVQYERKHGKRASHFSLRGTLQIQKKDGLVKGLDCNSGAHVLGFFLLFCGKFLVWSLTNTSEPISCVEIIRDQVLEYLGLFSSSYCREVS